MTRWLRWLLRIAPVAVALAISRAAFLSAGMALRPATPIEPYEDLLPELDMVLIMSVEPGFGGQRFLDVVLPKVRRAREAMAPDPPRPRAR